MKPVIYFRRDIVLPEEVAAAEKYFPVVFKRTAVSPGSLVIPRYSALPFNEELCEDLEVLKSSPINTHKQHCYVANLRNWYYDLAELTPRTWFYLDQIPDEGPFVLKGQTNSKKHQWNTHMFAKDKREAAEVFWRLCIDGHVGSQQVFIRKYEPLVQLAEGLNGLPISEEYRFFFLGEELIGAGFYWSSHTADLSKIYDPRVVPEGFLCEIVKRVSPHVRFWVVDVGRKVDGSWVVIELNDGQQSGLSDTDPDMFYRTLRDLLQEVVLA